MLRQKVGNWNWRRKGTNCKMPCITCSSLFLPPFVDTLPGCQAAFLDVPSSASGMHLPQPFQVYILSAAAAAETTLCLLRLMLGTVWFREGGFIKTRNWEDDTLFVHLWEWCLSHTLSSTLGQKEEGRQLPRRLPSDRNSFQRHHQPMLHLRRNQCRRHWSAGSPLSDRGWDTREPQTRFLGSRWGLYCDVHSND